MTETEFRKEVQRMLEDARTTMTGLEEEAADVLAEGSMRAAEYRPHDSVLAEMAFRAAELTAETMQYLKEIANYVLKTYGKDVSSVCAASDG